MIRRASVSCAIAAWGLTAGCGSGGVTAWSTNTTVKRAPIVGGVNDNGDPAIVEVLADDQGICTGSLVSPHVVLTAGHCIEGGPFAIFTGPNDDDRDGGEIIDAVASHVHPLYDGGAADMAVLILAEPFDVEPIPYQRTALTNDLVDQPVRIVGYGDNTVESPTQGFGRKRMASAPLIDFDEDWVYAGERAHNQCFGDSGGPALMTIEGVETIVGVDSWSESEDCDGFNANTRIDSFVTFLEEHIAEHDEADDGAGDGDDGPPIDDGDDDDDGPPIDDDDDADPTPDDPTPDDPTPDDLAPDDDQSAEDERALDAAGPSAGCAAADAAAPTLFSGLIVVGALRPARRRPRKTMS